MAGWLLNTPDKEYYLNITIPNDETWQDEVAKYIKYQNGPNPKVFLTMGVGQHMYGEDLYLPTPDTHSYPPMTETEIGQLYFGARERPQIDEAIEDMADLRTKAELERFRQACTKETLCNIEAQRFLD